MSAHTFFCATRIVRSFAFGSLLSLVICAQTTLPPAVSVPLPPMGWASWNSFSNTIDSAIVVRQAKAIVASGMERAGYRYMLIDEGWWLGTRDANGNITVDPMQWPAIAPGEKAGNMTNIVRYLHSLGLKAAIYTDAGEFGCSYAGPDLGPRRPHTGSLGHYNQDFLQFAKWGFDYVKVDWCGGDKANLDPATQYAEIAQSIARAETETGHSLYFSICNWGRQSPWTWGPGVGGVRADMWRTGGDISDPIVAGSIHANRRVGPQNVLTNFDHGIHPEAQHTGYYNDLDMMVLGMPGMNESADRLHMMLWAIAGSPLMVGADITKLSETDLAILKDPVLLAIDQDPLGVQCIKVAEPSPGLEVWAKPLARTGERAVLLLNRTDATAPITVKWSDIGLGPSASVQGVLIGQESGNGASSYPDKYTTNVAAGHATLLIVKGSDQSKILYRPSPSNNRSEIAFNQVRSSTKASFLEIAYRNNTELPFVAELRVNGQSATRLAFPPTGDATASVALEAQLLKESPNEIVFSSPCGPLPTLESMSLIW